MLIIENLPPKNNSYPCREGGMDEGLKDVRDEETLLFISFISMLYNSGIQQLGKIMNPITGKVHRDLNGARSTIEILEMLRKKTSGNLSDSEKRVMDSSISNLQLNYVEELENDKKRRSEGGKDEAPSTGETDKDNKKNPGGA
jgi:hypothetical protein